MSYIISEDKYSSNLNKTYEGMMAQGNGYFSVRGSFEEGLIDAPQNEIYTRTMKSVTTEIQRSPLSKYGTYIPTIMGDHPFLMEVIINLPYFLDFIVYIDDKKVDMLHSNISEYHRELNMKDGTLNRSFVLITDTTKIKFTFERFASMSSKHLFVQRISYEVLEGNGKISIESGINADITTNGFNHFKNIELEKKKENIESCITTDLDFKVYTITNLQSEKEASISVEKTEKQIKYILEEQFSSGDKNTFIKRSVMTTNRDLDNVNFIENGLQTLDVAIFKSYDELLRESQEIWAEKWNQSDIFIEGDKELQKGIRFSIYHLIRSNNEDDYRVQICAKGFAGEAYYGRYFWDSEIYLLPFYIYTNPKAARNMLMYRYYTLDGARKNAARYHCNGARYPWQSGLTGEEQCPLLEYADNEVHITADIAYAIMNYYKVTNDYDFVRDYGAEILIETSRFWGDRVNQDKKGMYHLINVMGPDEYSPMTKDNAFTNRLVQFNLRNAVKMVLLIKQKSPKEYDNLVSRLKLDKEELDKFMEIAENLHLPYDEDRDLYLQSADFEDYGEININEIWKDRNRAFGHYATQEEIYRTKCIKQADVIALMTLFPDEFTTKQVEIAYDYYLPYTTHDSSLSPAGHSFIANRLGRKEDVKKYLKQSLDVDLSLEKRGTEDGIHIANCGCLWQLVVQSFAGVSIDSVTGQVKVNSNLPEHIESISFSIIVKGEKKQITVS